MTIDVPNPYAAPLNTAPMLTPAEEKQWAILTHVLGIFFAAVPAIIIYVIYKDRGPFIKAHAATELNMQASVLLWTFVAFALSFGSVFLSFGAASSTTTSPSVTLFFVGYFGILAIRLISVVFGIMASVAANKGRYYRYPFVFRFVRDNIPA